jgi:hypothetical protein
MSEEWAENDILFTTVYWTQKQPDTVTGCFDKFVKRIDPLDFDIIYLAVDF